MNKNSIFITPNFKRNNKMLYITLFVMQLYILKFIDGFWLAGSSGRNLWISGLDPATRAQDLKSLLSKHGKVKA